MCSSKRIIYFVSRFMSWDFELFKKSLKQTDILFTCVILHFYLRHRKPSINIIEKIIMIKKWTHTGFCNWVFVAFPFHWYVLLTSFAPPFCWAKEHLHVTSFMKPLLIHLPPSKLDHSLYVWPHHTLTTFASVIRTFIALILIKANQITVWQVAQGN